MNYVHQRLFDLQKSTWGRATPTFPPGFNLNGWICGRQNGQPTFRVCNRVMALTLRPVATARMRRVPSTRGKAPAPRRLTANRSSPRRAPGTCESRECLRESGQALTGLGVVYLEWRPGCHRLFPKSSRTRNSPWESSRPGTWLAANRREVRAGKRSEGNNSTRRR